MKKSLIICLIVIPFLVSAQKEVGYLISDKGEKVIFYENTENKRAHYLDNVLKGDVNLTAQFVHYYDALGKLKRFKQADVSEMSYNNLKYMKLPIGSFGMIRLHEVIAENNNYVLTNYYHDGYFFYIFKKKGMLPVGRREMHSLKKKKDLKLLEKKIKPYFKDCPDLLTRIEKSIEDSNYKREYDLGAYIVKNNLFRYVSNFDCTK